jgi:succinate dehydrogenase / fumarate reductase iron-sulfur subunit
MPGRTVILRALRYKPGLIDPPRFQDFTIHMPQSASVLDALEDLRLRQDKTLMYRHACHHASCGTCACLINGHERLACATQLEELDCELIVVAPLRGFAVVGDLVVDMTAFYGDLCEDWSGLRAVAKSPGSPGKARPFSRFENCIECGACRSACPVTHTGQPFLGPAALAALDNELVKSPQKAAKLLSLADGPRGVQHCTRALTCSRVCPTGVFPARHIAALRRRLRQTGSQPSS